MTSTENAIKMCKNTKFPPLSSHGPGPTHPNSKPSKYTSKSFRIASTRLSIEFQVCGGGSHSLGMINQENPQVKTPNHKVSELHQFYGVGWGGGESQCWSTGTNECLRGADRQEHQSDKIKFFFVSYCYKILSRV